MFESSQQQQQHQKQQTLQFWRNSDKVAKNLNQNNNALTQQQYHQQQYINSLINNNIEVPAHLAQPQPQQPQVPVQQYHQPQPTQMQFVDTYVPSAAATPAAATPQPPVLPEQHVVVAEKKNESKNYIYANGYPIIYNNPLPQPHPAQVVIAPVPAPVVPVVPVGPYPVQQPIVSAQGDVIVENTIGGIPFDCRGRPTGHWRDTRFCDIFHACVHGYQRKTYACPIVGERTYFDEITKRCEFVSKNPIGCATNVFLK